MIAKQIFLLSRILADPKKVKNTSKERRNNVVRIQGLELYTIQGATQLLVHIETRR